MFIHRSVAGLRRLAMVIFGKLKSYTIQLGSILFGFCNSLRIVMNSNSFISVNLISMRPYVVNILALVLFVGCVYALC